MPPRAKRKRASAPASPAGSPATSRRTRSNGTGGADDADEEQAPVLVPVKGHWMHPTFATHRRQGLLLDATLVAGGTRIEAHKIVLITYSPYL
eukprot:COSAG01_NODE_730_length_14022_cov_127.417511_9_plen_93_part_00